MTKRLRKMIDSYWARHKAFRFALIITFFVLVIALAFLTAYSIFHEHYSHTMYVVILTILLAFAYKKGYGKRPSPKQRKLILAVSFGLGAAVLILALLRQLGWY